MEQIEGRCPQCGGVGHPIGHVGLRLVFQCNDCNVRFKVGGEDEAADRGR
jgi:hypothetical protein